MKINVTAVRKSLKSFDFPTLFREHLGWDKHQARLDVPIGENTWTLYAVAQKRGFTAYLCDAIPDRATRLRIDHQVTKSAREHFVIYADKAAGQQVWQWVRRDAGKPIASRDHRFDVTGIGRCAHPAAGTDCRQSGRRRSLHPGSGVVQSPKSI